MGRHHLQLGQQLSDDIEKPAKEFKYVLVTSTEWVIGAQRSYKLRARSRCGADAHPRSPFESHSSQRDRQRDQRKKIEDTVKRAQKFKVTWYDKTMKAQKLYQTKCREADKLDEEWSRNGPSLPPKEAEKVSGGHLLPLGV